MDALTVSYAFCLSVNVTFVTVTVTESLGCAWTLRHGSLEKFWRHWFRVFFFQLQKQVEFLVEYADTEKAVSKPVNFNVTPETLQNIREVNTSF